MVNWTFRNKHQWNFNRNSYIIIQDKAFQNLVCKMSAMLSWPRCVKLDKYTSIFSYIRIISVHVNDIFITRDSGVIMFHPVCLCACVCVCLSRYSGPVG